MLRKGEGQEKEQEMSLEVTTPESPTRVIASALTDLSESCLVYPQHQIMPGIDGSLVTAG